MKRKLLLQQENKIVYIRYGMGSVKALKGSLSPDSNFTRLNENPALLGNLPFDSKVFVKGKKSGFVEQYAEAEAMVQKTVS